MSFRSRILLAALPLALLPLALFALAVRRELGGRVEALYRERVEATAAVIRQDLDRSAALVDDRLGRIASAMDRDDRLRAALLQPPSADRSYVLDWAGDAMRDAGLDLVQLQDAGGRILSSGHFRNEYDRVDAGAALLGANPGSALLQARTPSGSMLALARARTVNMGPERLLLVGGIAIDTAFVRDLARAGTGVALQSPAGTIGDTARSAPGTTVAEEVTLPFIDATDPEPDAGEASFLVTHPLAPLHALRRRIDTWLILAAAATALLALFLAHWIATRVSRPVAELARNASRVDLDRLDVGFALDRSDEVGTLSRVLDAMTGRLRASATRLREAERRATVGEMARQVNHDVKNGLVPIRNVVRHLGEVAKEDPAAVGAVFAERQNTLEAGIGYLEALATNYARLSPRNDRRRCDVNAVVRDVVRHASARPHHSIRVQLDDGAPTILGDPVALRRIVENLVANALESLPDGPGTVVVGTRTDNGAAGGRVRITVADDGHGMTADEVKRIFDDFYTTRARGTGLGLSIVRRLAADLGGSVRVESELGAGSRFRVELPAAPRSGRQRGEGSAS
ncbi:MAG: ATP-binding protein [Longimicrobiales bacterium]